MTVTVNKRNAGFTTIELAMVIIIFGMILGTIMTVFAFYNAERVKTHTQEAFDTVNAALLSFQATEGRYPCPADPAIPRGGLGYGLENVDGSGQCVANATSVFAATTTGIDQDDNGANDIVFIGAVPFNTILDPDGLPNSGDELQGIPLRDITTYDGWGRKLTYAVSGTLTDSEDYNDYFGSIRVVDENRRSLIQEREFDTNNDGIVDPSEDLNGDGIHNEGQYAHFVVVSHGENGRGAYSSAGVQAETCPNFLPVATPPMVASNVNELENCDHNIDATFLSGLRNDADSSKNDDLTKFTINETSGLWVYADGSADQIHNTNSGNVGFGEDVPRERLEINGNLRSQGIRSAAYCENPLDADCMKAEAIAGDLAEMTCPPGQAITGIDRNAVNDATRSINLCAPVFSGPINACTCAPGCRVTGFRRNSNGSRDVVCHHRTTNNPCACTP